VSPAFNIVSVVITTKIFYTLDAKGFAMVKDKRPAMELYRVARKKKPGEGPGAQVRIDADLVAKARYLAAHSGLELSGYLSALLRPMIEREFKKVGREMMGGDE
jgi:hypothetical protein